MPCYRRPFLPRVEKITWPGGRREYRAMVARTIEPKELGLAGAVQIARIDRRIGAKGELRQTWLVTSRLAEQLSEATWLALEQGRWGIENRTHHTLDVSHREDESRVRQPNVASVLGIFRRVSNALKQVWARGRPPGGSGLLLPVRDRATGDDVCRYASGRLCACLWPKRCPISRWNRAGA